MRGYPIQRTSGLEDPTRVKSNANFQKNNQKLKAQRNPSMMFNIALVAQRIEHLTTDQKVGGSSPSKRTL